MTMRWTYVGAVAAVLAAAGGAWGKVDSMYYAAQTLGVRLYWVPEDGVSPDTVGWDALAGPLPEERVSALTSLAAAARELDSAGWRLYRVKNCSAMGLALLADLGHPVGVLCQWHASLKNKVKVPKPGMSQKEIRHSLVSDHRWEAVERTSIESVGNAGDLRVHIFFAGRGQSQYDCRDAVVGMNRQVAGIDGVVIRMPELAFEEDLNIRRTASAICVVAPSDVTAKDIVSGIERAMDRRKLDLSYTVPVVEAVAPGAQTPAKKPDGVPEGEPDTAQEKRTDAEQAQEPDAGAGAGADSLP
jgi:hypothetical protein